MRKIPPTASLLTYLDDLDYSEAALSADEDTAELAAPFRAEIEGWDGVFKSERQSRRGVTRSEAVVAVRNGQLDRYTLRFGASVLGEAGGDRKGTFFRRFFSVAPSQFVRQSLRKQCEQTLHVMLVELDKLDQKHPLKAHAAPLEGFARAALAALDARSKVKAERGIAAHDVDEWKEGVNALRLTTYAELLKVAAEKGYGRAWADAFFPSDAGAVLEEPEAQPAPAPAGGDKPDVA